MTRKWQFCLGVGLLGGFVGVPIVKVIIHIAALVGWVQTLRDLILCAVWSVAVWLGIYLLVSSLFVGRREKRG